jgi:adenylate cyclase
VVAGAAITAALVLAVVTWFAIRVRPDVSPSAEPSKTIAVGAMPVIAVLPFANQTGDDSQEYFADGMTEEVINALGRFHTLRVIGRNAVLRYKKQPPTQEEIGSELGASYWSEEA